MIRRSILVRLLVVPLALIGVLTMQQSALAHYVYQQGIVSTHDGYCTDLRAEVSHGSGGGYIKLDVTSLSDNFFWNFRCTDPNSKPAGYIALADDYYKWDEPSQSWFVCQQGPWRYNSQNTARLTHSSDKNVPCGWGYYGSMGYGYVLDNQWWGGGIWSGYHFLPA